MALTFPVLISKWLGRIVPSWPFPRRPQTPPGRPVVGLRFSAVTRFHLPAEQARRSFLKGAASLIDPDAFAGPQRVDVAIDASHTKITLAGKTVVGSQQSFIVAQNPAGEGLWLDHGNRAFLRLPAGWSPKFKADPSAPAFPAKPSGNRRRVAGRLADELVVDIPASEATPQCRVSLWMCRDTDLAPFWDAAKKVFVGFPGLTEKIPGLPLAMSLVRAKDGTLLSETAVEDLALVPIPPSEWAAPGGYRDLREPGKPRVPLSLAMPPAEEPETPANGGAVSDRGIGGEDGQPVEIPVIASPREDLLRDAASLVNMISRRISSLQSVAEPGGAVLRVSWLDQLRADALSSSPDRGGLYCFLRQDEALREREGTSGRSTRPGFLDVWVDARMTDRLSELARDLDDIALDSRLTDVLPAGGAERSQALQELAAIIRDPAVEPRDRWAAVAAPLRETLSDRFRRGSGGLTDFPIRWRSPIGPTSFPGEFLLGLDFVQIELRNISASYIGGKPVVTLAEFEEGSPGSIAVDLDPSGLAFGGQLHLTPGVAYVLLTMGAALLVLLWPPLILIAAAMIALALVIASDVFGFNVSLGAGTTLRLRAAAAARDDHSQEFDVDARLSANPGVFITPFTIPLPLIGHLRILLSLLALPFANLLPLLKEDLERQARDVCTRFLLNPVGLRFPLAAGAFGVGQAGIAIDRAESESAVGFGLAALSTFALPPGSATGLLLPPARATLMEELSAAADDYAIRARAAGARHYFSAAFSHAALNLRIAQLDRDGAFDGRTEGLTDNRPVLDLMPDSFAATRAFLQGDNSGAGRSTSFFTASPPRLEVRQETRDGASTFNAVFVLPAQAFSYLQPDPAGELVRLEFRAETAAVLGLGEPDGTGSLRLPVSPPFNAFGGRFVAPYLDMDRWRISGARVTRSGNASTPAVTGLTAGTALDASWDPFFLALLRRFLEPWSIVRVPLQQSGLGVGTQEYFVGASVSGLGASLIADWSLDDASGRRGAAFMHLTLAAFLGGLPPRGDFLDLLGSADSQCGARARAFDLACLTGN